MSELYPWIKWIHILSSTLLFGTGIGTAFQMWMAHRSGDARAIAVVARHTVLADWLFTLTSAIVQPLSGFALVYIAGFDPLAGWLVATYVLYVVAALCWFRVAWLQVEVRRLAAEAAARGAPLPEAYFRFMRQWFLLGWPAFLGLVAVFALMIMKPDLG